MQHSRSTAAVTVVAVEVLAAAVEAAAFTAEGEALTAVVVDLTAVGGLLVAEVTTKEEAFVVSKGPDLMERVAVMERAAVLIAGLELGVVSG